MGEPVRAGEAPAAKELEKGKAYGWCACGLSSRQPFCDGSHKATAIKPVVFRPEREGTHYLCMCKQTKTKPYCDGSHTE